MTEFKRQSLEIFISDKSGVFPPVFVGRKDIIDEVLATSRRAFERGDAPPKNTIVIQGAPGAGKTSILTELQNKAAREDCQLRPVIVTPADIETRRTEVLKAIAVVASKQKADWLNMVAAAGSDLAQRANSISFLLFSADFASMVKDTEPEDLFALRDMLPPEKWANPVILAIDEAQRFAGDHTTPHAQFLQYIHDANQIQLPLTIVFAGLDDTDNRVDEMGVTNGVFPHTIGALRPQELEQIVDGFCTYFGIQIGKQYERLHSFFDSTECWPRHICWAQKALSESLLPRDVNGQLDKISDWSAAEKRRDQYRIGYYENRNSEDMRRSKKLVAAVLQIVESHNAAHMPFDLADIGNLIDDFLVNPGHSDRGWRVPEKFGAGDGAVDRYIAHLVHQGALAKDVSDTAYRCPIPSFMTGDPHADLPISTPRIHPDRFIQHLFHPPGWDDILLRQS